MASLSADGPCVGISRASGDLRNRVIWPYHYDVLAIDCSSDWVSCDDVNYLTSNFTSEENVEKVGGFTVIAKEGGITAMGVFMVTWVINRI